MAVSRTTVKRVAQPQRWPKAGARGDTADAAARDRWGQPLPLFASTPVRGRRQGKQLWTPAFATQVSRVADHLVVSGVAEKTAAKYESGFRDFEAFTDNMPRDSEESWPVFLDGSDPRREEDHLLNFVAYQGWLLGLSHSAVAGKLAAIRWQHVVEGVSNPLEGKARLRAAMKKLKKMRGDSHSKLPVTADMLRHVKSTLDMSDDRDVTLWAALCFGWFFCLWQSEYLADGGVFDARRRCAGGRCSPWSRSNLPPTGSRRTVCRSSSKYRRPTRTAEGAPGRCTPRSPTTCVSSKHISSFGGCEVRRGIPMAPSSKRRTGGSPRETRSPPRLRGRRGSSTSPSPITQPTRCASAAPRRCSVLACRLKRFVASGGGPRIAGGATYTRAERAREGSRRKWPTRHTPCKCQRRTTSPPHPPGLTSPAPQRRRRERPGREREGRSHGEVNGECGGCVSRRGGARRRRRQRVTSAGAGGAHFPAAGGAATVAPPPHTQSHGLQTT